MTTKELADSQILWGQNEIVSILFTEELLGSIDDIERLDDVLEWWLVTPFMAECLRRRGEFILDECDCHWWGRTTSGQALWMDAVVKRIADEMTI